MDNTKTRILDTAERLFGDRGPAATTHRAIASAAGVNLAAINYHFRSKEGLIRCVYARRIEPVNERRLKMLDDCERKHGSGTLPLETVLEAFIAPVVQLGAESGSRSLMGRMYMEPGDFLRKLILEHMEEVAMRFEAALQRSLPGISEVDICWGAFFTIGVLAHGMQSTKLLETVCRGSCDTSDTDVLTRRLVEFAAGGLRSLARAAKRTNGSSIATATAPSEKRRQSDFSKPAEDACRKSKR